MILILTNSVKTMLKYFNILCPKNNISYYLMAVERKTTCFLIYLLAGWQSVWLACLFAYVLGWSFVCLRIGVRTCVLFVYCMRGCFSLYFEFYHKFVDPTTIKTRSGGYLWFILAPLFAHFSAPWVPLGTFWHPLGSFCDYVGMLFATSCDTANAKMPGWLAGCLNWLEIRTRCKFRAPAKSLNTKKLNIGFVEHSVCITCRTADLT